MVFQKIAPVLALSSVFLANGAAAEQFSEYDGYDVVRPYGMQPFQVNVPCVEERVREFLPSANFTSEIGLVSAVSDSRAAIVTLYDERAESDLGMVRWLSVSWDEAQSTITYQTNLVESTIQSQAPDEGSVKQSQNDAMTFEGKIRSCSLPALTS